jgi:hypothetical protein
VDCPKHDVCWVGSLSIMGVVEEYIPEGKHQEILAAVYRRIMATIEAAEAYSNQIYEIEPSEN